MRKAFDITLNGLRIQLTNFTTFLLALILPLFFTAVLGVGMAAAFGGEGDNRYLVALADEDGGVVAAQVRTLLADSSVVRIEERTRQEATRLVEDKDALAMIVLPAGFSQRVLAGQKAEVEFIFSDPANSARIQEEIGAVLARVSGTILAAQIAVEEAERIEPFADEAARQAYFDAALKLAQAKMESPPVGVEVEQATALLEKENQVPVGVGQTSPGMLVMFSLLTLLGASGGLVEERRIGTLRRLLSTPTAKGSILGGKILTYYAVGLGQMIILILFGQLAFGVNWGQSPLALALVVVSFGLAAVSLGVLLSTLVRTEQQAGTVMSSTSMVMAALGGCWWPLDIVPGFMRTIGHLFPSAWAMDGFQDIIARGLGVRAVLPEVGVLLGFATVFFAVGIWRFRYE